MDADSTAYYVDELRKAKADVEAAEKALADARERRNTVMRLAVDVGKISKTDVARLMGLNRNTIKRATADTLKANKEGGNSGENEK